MKNLLLLFIIIIISCKSSSDLSFISLNNAFINWYYKFHPVKASLFGKTEYYNKFRKIGIDENEEYIADISRFLIELSQIDATKLDAENYIDYQILYVNLEKLNYIMKDIRPWEWNPLWTLEEINRGLFILSERKTIDMDDRVDAVQNRLKLLPEILESAKENLTFYSSLHCMRSNILIETIVHLIDHLPLKLYSDNITLDKIDDYILRCKSSLLDYQKWLNEKAIKLPKFQYPVNLNLSDHGFSYYVGKKYVQKNVADMAQKNRISTQKKLFDYALPIYLIENDEPIWLDWDDTLEVIHWTIDQIRNKPINQVSSDNIVSYFYNSISSIEKFVFSNNLIPDDVNKKIELMLVPDYIRLNSQIHLFDYHPKHYRSKIIYYINAENDAAELFPLISQEIDIKNTQFIIPGWSIQIGYAQRNNSLIRYIFPDQIHQLGWQIYATSMIFNEDYGDWEDTYHILKLKEELIIICQAIIETKYYSGEITRKEALRFYKKEAFLNNSNAENIILRSDLNYFSGTQAFIGLLELNSIKKEFMKQRGDDYNILDFHREILKNGVIPFYQLKKNILSM